MEIAFIHGCSPVSVASVDLFLVASLPQRYLGWFCCDPGSQGEHHGGRAWCRVRPRDVLVSDGCKCFRFLLHCTLQDINEVVFMHQSEIRGNSQPTLHTYFYFVFVSFIPLQASSSLLWLLPLFPTVEHLGLFLISCFFPSRCDRRGWRILYSLGVHSFWHLSSYYYSPHCLLRRM